MRGRLAIAACASALVLAACGDDLPEVATINASSAADETLAAAIETELSEYSEQFSLTALPAQQQAMIAEVIDNFPQAAGTVSTLDVADGQVVARTGLRADAGGELTARLVCGAILRAIADEGADDPGGHVVLDGEGQPLRDCVHADKNFP